MTKTAVVKVPVTEIIEGATVKGNLIGGFHVVTRIVIRTAVLRNTSTSYSFYNEADEEFFIGRINAKATLRN